MNKKKDYKLKTNTFLNFKEHLEGSDFVFLSAPFGFGKTTFIKDFISSEGDKSKYNFFHLYPVHYAVNKNDDVFELIKYDLLFELLKLNDITEEIIVNYKEATKKIVEKNIKAILLSFVEKIPEIGKTLKEITGFFKIVEKEILELYEQEFNTPELNSFISTIENTKGSIFENDIITTYINNKLVDIKKGDSGKKNILILDDLDRIDPEHIFRLLNIFSANFDNSGYSVNKFGIDKVIIVADYYNVKSIYHHKYGKYSDFEGFINKFYSKDIYFLIFYDAIKNLFKEEYGLYEYSDFPEMKINLLTILFNNKKISFRQIKKISKMNFNRERSLFDVIDDLVQLFNGDYKDLIRACSEVSTEIDRTIDKSFWDALLKSIISFYFKNGKEKIEEDKSKVNKKEFKYSLYNKMKVSFEFDQKEVFEVGILSNSINNPIHKSIIWKEFLSLLKEKFKNEE